MSSEPGRRSACRVLRSHHTAASAFALDEALRGCFQQRALGLTARSAPEDAEILLDLFLHGVLNHHHEG